MAEPNQPDPDVWPQCEGCDTPYVLRRALSWSEGRRWVWMQDCKHDKRKAQPGVYVANAEGRLVQ